MIYVFNFAKHVCTLPGQACLALAKSFEHLEVYCSGGLQRCADCFGKSCASVGGFITDFGDRPLSTYVLIKVVLSIAGLRACLNALQEPSLSACAAHGSVGVKTWLAVQMGFACLNLLFAPYFQIKVWRAVLQEAEKIPPSSRGDVQIPAAKVHESFRSVLLRDVPVCLYALVLLASFAWSCLGTGLVSSKDCNPEGWSAEACNLGFYFFWVALVYTACYYCLGCCASSVVLRRPITDGRESTLLAGGSIPVPVPSAPPLAGFPPDTAVTAQQACWGTAPPLEGFPAQPSAASQPLHWAGAAPMAPSGVVALPMPQRQRPQEHPRVSRCWLLSCFCAYFLPPVGVFMRFGFGRHVAICTLLTFFGYVPGLFYAFAVLACEPGGEAREQDAAEDQKYYIMIA